MKKLFYSILCITFITACNNSSNTSKVSPDSSGSGNNPGMQNVNGNVPDTSDAIKLNKPLPKDSSRVTDSTHH